MSRMARWDFFLSHTGADVEIAERLFDALTLDPSTTVFLDTRCLLAGADFDREIPDAQRNSSITVVLVSASTEQAYYQRDEKTSGIRMALGGGPPHLVIPVYLGRRPDDKFPKPFGFEVLHSLFAPDVSDLSTVARSLLERMKQFKRTSWEEYRGLLDFDGYRVPYIPLFNDSETDTPISKLSLPAVKIQGEAEKYELPKEFTTTPLRSQFHNDPSCRLSSYDLRAGELKMFLSETSYEDYLISGEHLDDPLPDEKSRTFRDSFGLLIRDGERNLRPFNLTNICGVGIFIVSQDKHVIITKHSEYSHVYPGRMTYSASGVMKWGAYPHPFTEIMRKCFEETRHQIDPKELQLIGFGVDARKLYFQFSFVERTGEKFPDIFNRFPNSVSVYHIPFELEQLVSHVVKHCWEPAAEAALLVMCVDEFGLKSVREALVHHKGLWDKRQMRDEWDYRASRPRLLPDMSVRYPADELARESKRYVDAVLRFIGDEIRDKDVLEIGCGTGRITERLKRRVRSVTCVDLCERMILKNKQRLGSRAADIEYINKFAQEYVPERHFDVAVCSLVLIHNVYDSQFNDLIRMMCRHAGVVYAFEDVTENRGTSPHTELRSEEAIKQAFARCDYFEDLGKDKHYQLFGDRIVFLRFVRRRNRRLI